MPLILEWTHQRIFNKAAEAAHSIHTLYFYNVLTNNRNIKKNLIEK